MNKFVRNLITEWRRLRLVVSGERVVVAISGGADSAALLAAIADARDRGKIELDLVAAHFNHNIRGEASLADQEFVERLAEKLNVQFVAASGRIQKRGNLEQNARNARYDFLRNAALETGAQLVLTGHTMNDQAETFLLNLIRGSGHDGLSAMHAIRPLDQSASPNAPILLARPLLRWAKRGDTEAFCEDLSIDFRRDEMNDDQAFNRVKVRKVLIPLLKEFNPKIIDTLCSTAQRISDTKTAPRDDGMPDILGVSELAKLPAAEMLQVIRSWLAGKRGSLRGIEAKHLEAVQRLVLSRKSGKTVELPGRQAVSKHGGRLVFEAIMVDK